MHQRAHRGDFARMAQINLGPLKAVWIFIGDKGGGDVPAFKPVMIIDRLKEGNIVPNTVELKFVEGALHRIYGDAAVLAPCAELGNHRVIIHRDFAAFINACIIAND